MKKFSVMILAMLMVLSLCGCGEITDLDVANENIKQDTQKTQMAAGTLQSNQPTPTDIDYSLERYNLIRRAYWVNGQREKANALVCQVVKPLGYIALFTESGAVIERFIVDGKVTSLNSYLTPDSEYYEQEYGSNGFSYGDGNNWLADVDGSYGENDAGIFFFTPDGKYVEWTGTYLYSDIPFEIEDPMIKIGE